MPTQPVRIDYETELNPAQLEATFRIDGPVLVIAGAGSGKTRTLIFRLARMLEQGILPNEILLLTFTRKAAHEMIHRAGDLLHRRCEDISGGTFHAFANRILRRYAGKIGFPNSFTILDRADADSLVGLIRKDMGLGKTKGFPKSGTLVSLFSKAANKQMTIEDLLFDEYHHLMPHMDTLTRLYYAYQEQKNQLLAMDYDDLLLNLYRLLAENDAVTRELNQTIRYIMVDEYQDTNLVQAQIVAKLAGSDHNVMAVGDDAQSIYAFRGANFENIMQFPELFPKTHLIRLEENYRSVQPILDVTNQIIEKASRKYAKHLFSQKTLGHMPTLVQTLTENDQSRYIVEQVLRMYRQGTPLHEMAVLFRAGFHSFDLEIELTRNNIPFVKVGGFKFMDSAHIKDVLAHLRVIQNPQDRLSWYRILSLLEGAGPKTAQTISTEITQSANGILAANDIKMSAKVRNSIAPLQKMMEDILKAKETLSVSEMGKEIIQYYMPILKLHHDDYPKRLRDLDQLLDIMDRYQPLDSFLTDMALDPPTNSTDDTFMTRDNITDKLMLSTVHSAKGLEWQSVFVLWALDGRFPSVQSLGKATEIEEELRLMYVAATRAKEKLFFTCPSQVYDRGADMLLTRPSRFIDDIDEDILSREVFYKNSYE